MSIAETGDDNNVIDVNAENINLLLFDLIEKELKLLIEYIFVGSISIIKQLVIKINNVQSLVMVDIILKNELLKHSKMGKALPCPTKTTRFLRIGTLELCLLMRLQRQEAFRRHPDFIETPS